VSGPADCSTSSLLPIEALSADGLLIRSDGAFVRALEVTPANPLVLDEAGCERMTLGLCELLARVPAGMSVQLYAQADPVDLDTLLTQTRAETDAATAHLLHGDRYERSQGEALRALAACHEHALAVHAHGHAAVQVRFALICPYLPDANRRAAPVLRRSQSEHDRLARESQAHTDHLASALAGCDLPARPLDGSGFADLLWRRMCPRTSSTLPHQAPGRHLAFGLAHTPRQAARSARDLRAAICQAPVEFSGRRHVGVDGELEHVLYVARRPERTFYGWLLHAMQAPCAWTLSVHVHVSDRRAMRERYRRRARRLWGLNTGTRDAGRRPDRDQEAQEDELEQVADELATGAETVCDTAIYQALRHPDPDDPATLDAMVATAARDLAAPVDCGISLGDFQQHDLWQSTLPLGLDTARRTWRGLSRHAADTSPLVWTGCGSREGIPFAFAEPGRTVERLDPFDRVHDNAAMLVFAKSGGGKTATVIHLASAAMPRGCQVHVLDRSTGHYQFLASLIPGAAHLHLGTETGPAVNPWDTPDPAAVPKAKVAFLVALHALLIGDHADTGFGLDSLERNLLALAIRQTYTRAAASGQTPRERLLRDELLALADAEADNAEAAAGYRSLAARLGEFCGEGTYAHLFDRETTVAVQDAPLVVFNVRSVPDDLLTAVLFCVFEFVAARVERRYHAQQAQARSGGSSLAGTSMLVLEELSELIRRPATGAWINAHARRARHIGLWLVAITQQRADLAGDHGRALLDNSTIQLFLRQGPDDVAHVADALHLTSEEVAQISQLRTEKGAFAQAYLINGSQGRGTVTIRLGPELYWIATSDPHHDGPRRQAALDEADGDPWAALELLCDPAWQAAQDHNE
jgi:hypothetical protein